ncbi:hypothetical protein GC175_30145 [bacterium]|nr:hypothetical protein [bacterium]
MMEIDGSNLRRLTRHDADDMNPAWSPDGRWIVFVSNRGSDRTVRSVYNLYVMATDGSNQCQLMQGDQPAQEPVWSTDGQSGAPQWAGVAYPVSTDFGGICVHGGLGGGWGVVRRPSSAVRRQSKSLARNTASSPKRLRKDWIVWLILSSLSLGVSKMVIWRAGGPRPLTPTPMRRTVRSGGRWVASRCSARRAISSASSVG